MSEEGVIVGPTGDAEEQQEANAQQGGRKSYISHVLFDMKGSLRREWKYVRLVVKEELTTKKDVKSSDASKAYCTC